eukprot:TRINITY_DN40311_c0_g1_i5.p1 TRINITY_DN40311_c0_g1~~TRINITY_DN40311_c0_g1_i5.p1  ORF type:complete len:422 (+),score=99.30 TRINITY_DN40311_c0_g1_i5:69-1334(+)
MAPVRCSSRDVAARGGVRPTTRGGEQLCRAPQPGAGGAPSLQRPSLGLCSRPKPSDKSSGVSTCVSVIEATHAPVLAPALRFGHPGIRGTASRNFDEKQRIPDNAATSSRASSSEGRPLVSNGHGACQLRIPESVPGAAAACAEASSAMAQPFGREECSEDGCNPSGAFVDVERQLAELSLRVGRLTESLREVEGRVQALGEPRPRQEWLSIALGDAAAAAKVGALESLAERFERQEEEFESLRAVCREALASLLVQQRQDMEVVLQRCREEMRLQLTEKCGEAFRSMLEDWQQGVGSQGQRLERRLEDVVERQKGLEDSLQHLLHSRGGLEQPLPELPRSGSLQPLQPLGGSPTPRMGLERGFHHGLGLPGIGILKERIDRVQAAAEQAQEEERRLIDLERQWKLERSGVKAAHSPKRRD